MVYENTRGGDAGAERGGGKGEARAPYRRGKKPNPLTAAKVEKVDFKDVTLLKYFVTERGKIIPRRITGVTSKQQRQIAQAVKRARVLGLLPFVRLEG